MLGNLGKGVTQLGHDIGIKSGLFCIFCQFLQEFVSFCNEVLNILLFKHFGEWQSLLRLSTSLETAHTLKKKNEKMKNEK